MVGDHTASERDEKTMSNDFRTSIRTRPPEETTLIDADICVLGAGMSGLSAALEASRLGRKVVLVDAGPAIGGQAVGSIVGTIIGLYTHGDNPYQITHGIADELIEDLTAEGAINKRKSQRTFTITYQYDEVRLARWFERKVEEAGIQVLVGAILTDVDFRNRRVEQARFATRFGPVTVEARGWVDASGDAALSWNAGLPVREPDSPIYGSLNFLMEGYKEEAVVGIDHEAVYARLREKGADYGLVRHDGFLFAFPGKGIALANITHMETPLEPLAGAEMVFEGRRQADAVIQFLRAEFPLMFANVRIRAYGTPGIRQTRWIVGRRQLTLEDLKKAERPPDAVARCCWWVELHSEKDLVHWERFDDGHVYYIPLTCMTPKDADNIVTAGRAVDGDTEALSAVRVIGPCIAMGAAAAYALDLADGGSVHELDLAELQKRLAFNLDRTD